MRFTLANPGRLNITTRRGDLVSVPADTFIYRRGSPVGGEVIFKVRDIFTKIEMFGSGFFSVTANNKPMISGG
ncbi:MAG: hypothetical protein ACI8P7_001311 [Candidatus Azotimanducaceae bacterium]|jgi:hypothetical protein